jgi:hypothetical protein
MPPRLLLAERSPAAKRQSPDAGGITEVQAQSGLPRLRKQVKQRLSSKIRQAQQIATWTLTLSL